MNAPQPLVTPQDAWQRLPEAAFTGANARHLLRRAGCASTPGQVQEAVRRGLAGTLRHIFGQSRPFKPPESVQHLEASRGAFLRKIKSLSGEERRMAYRERRKENAEAYREMALAWLAFARQPENTAQEMLVSFLQNVLVVSYEKVRSMSAIHAHQELLRQGIQGTYPDLCKQVSRSPAMIRYLDLNRSTRKAPNENFARELFELFILGVGNYTERDIKEAARAFTGYGWSPQGFRLKPWAVDKGRKTVFGKSGHFRGDDIIDLAFEQPAARTFLPGAFVRAYVCEEGLPAPYIESLGEAWAARDFHIGALAELVFGSVLFYENTMRARLIKSPEAFVLGLHQDLRLDVAPIARHQLTALRAMGQQWYQPPNVRGWVGGRQWISAATLSARRQYVQRLFEPLEEGRLNADDRRALETAREAGAEAFTVDAERLEPLAAMPPKEAAAHLCRYFLPVEPGSDYREALARQISSGEGARIANLRKAVVALLQSPLYNLT